MSKSFGVLLLLASLCGATAAPSVSDTVEEEDSSLNTDNVS